MTAEYPYDTPRGRLVTAPQVMNITQRAPLALFDRLLGEKCAAADIVQKLTAYGVQAALDGEAVVAAIPSYRQDYLHPVDVMEDFIVSRGYAAFTPILPEDFTIGRLHPLTTFEDLLRDLLIGFGFEEAVCNILTGPETLRQRMEVSEAAGAGVPPFHGGRLVRIANVMNVNFAVLRDWILPSLLEVESHSEGAIYPHRIFEVGEVAVFDPAENLGSRTESRAGLIVADETASFDTLQTVVHALLNTLKVPFRVVPWEHPSFIPGRVGLVVRDGGGAKYGGAKDGGANDPSTWLGFLGEFSPQVLTRWGARMPAVGMELSVDRLKVGYDQARTK